MATKLFLRPPHSSLSPLLSLFPSKTHPFPKPPQTLSVSVSVQTHLSFSYGPSLQKGTSPKTHEEKPSESANPDHPLDESQFTRVFEIAAIRVPSKDCAALESRLRGHLLNWPRIRNIARVPGDDIDDPAIAALLAGADAGDGEGELSPVLRRDELVRKFDSRGFVRFRNLAKISRPKKRKRKEEGPGPGPGPGRREMAVVEVVESGEEGNVGELKGLLGEEFEGRGEWKGPTRLLLLDERCSTECVNDLPQAIKV